MTPAIAATALYCGLNGLVLVWLMVATIRLRFQEKVYMGDGGNQRVMRIMRGHANAIEAIPAGLILILVLALMDVPLVVIHVLGIALTLGRVLHALHFIAADAPRWQRAGGAILTMSMLGFGSFCAIIWGFLNL